jgi:predicted DsbA family dithiol-disulfide isomerase
MLYANWSGENVGTFADKRLVAFAEALGLDMQKFNSCFQENRYKAEIDADIAKATQMGVQGTPSVCINGTLLKPGFVPSFEDIKQAVEAAQ